MVGTSSEEADPKRIEFMFELYEKYTRGLIGEEKKKGKKK